MVQVEVRTTLFTRANVPDAGEALSWQQRKLDLYVRKLRRALSFVQGTSTQSAEPPVDDFLPSMC